MVSFPSIALLLLCFSCSSIFGGTSASGSLLDVSNAVFAAVTGETVIVPSGSNYWTTGLTIDKSIRLKGNSTVICFSNAPNQETITVSGAPITIEGFEFWTENSRLLGFIGLFDSDGFRITRNVFHVSNTKTNDNTDRALWVEGSSSGVIDSCWFLGTSGDIQGLYGTGPTNNWHRPFTYGTTNCICIENCVFSFVGTGDGPFDGRDGAAFTFRHNLVTNTLLGVHGTESDPRGVRQFEVYKNEFYAPGYNCYTGFHIHGGSGVVFSNSFGTNYNAFSTLAYNRANSEWVYGYYGWASGSNWVDGNFDASGYPALDQPGRGSFPTSATYPMPTGTNAGISYYSTNAYEAFEGVYFHSNIFAGALAGTGSVGVDTFNCSANLTNFIKPNRDYFEDTAKPGYTPLVYPHPLVTAQDQIIRNIGTLRVNTLRSL